MNPNCAVGESVNNRWNRMRVRLVLRTFFPSRGNYTKVVVFKNNLIDVRIGLERGRRILRRGNGGGKRE
jgi:hypothetical protein